MIVEACRKEVTGAPSWQLEVMNRDHRRSRKRRCPHHPGWLSTPTCDQVPRNRMTEYVEFYRAAEVIDIGRVCLAACRARSLSSKSNRRKSVD